MGTILIIVGAFCLISFAFGAYSPFQTILGCVLIFFGIKIKKSKSKRSNSSNGGYYQGRVKVDNTRYVYGNDGELYDVQDGSFTQGLDGRYRDNSGHVVDVDDDGELRMY